MPASQSLSALSGVNQFFAPVPFDLIDDLVTKYREDRREVERLADTMTKPENAQYIQYFIEGNAPEARFTLSGQFVGLFESTGAVAKLNAHYWSTALNMTDVYDHMPQPRREQWYEQIKNPQGVVQRKSYSSEPDKVIIQPLPDFEEDTVRATLVSLLNNRGKFFAERVDGIFRSLSRSHVTNRPEGFSKRMILPRVVTGYGSVDHTMAGYISDLRCVIARFMGRDEPANDSTRAILNYVREDNGQWFEIDGGALRIRIYNGVGTAHLEVHPDMAWRLNAVLASIHPAAIPHKLREKPSPGRKRRSIVLVDQMLPVPVLEAIQQLTPKRALSTQGRLTSNFKTLPNTLGFPVGLDKHVFNAVNQVMAAIGGVAMQHYWQFSYNPASVVGEILCHGTIPDFKSHQFYPTQQPLAQRALEIALDGTDATSLWLEPSAGTGCLADALAEGVEKELISLIEVSPLHCQVLEAKGYSNIICTDFLEFAQASNQKYDRILMNPPFDQGRWQAHLEAACRLIAQKGRVIAIVPASAKGKVLVTGFEHEYTEVLENQFSGTSISVVIVSMRRITQ